MKKKEVAPGAATLARTNKGDGFTPWFPGEVRPVRPGVYQRRIPLAKPHGRAWSVERYLLVYARWNGKCWLAYGMTAKAAAQNRAVSSFRGCPWRGRTQP